MLDVSSYNNFVAELQRSLEFGSAACMAPDIVTAILEGRQPERLTAKTLARVDLPLAWDAQRSVLGFS